MFWLKYLAITLLAYLLSIVFTIDFLPFSIFLIYSLVILNYLKDFQKRAVSIFLLGCLIDILEGGVVGMTSLFFLIYTLLFDWLKDRYLNFHPKIILLLRVIFGFVLNYIYTYGLRTVLLKISDKFIVLSAIGEFKISFLVVSLILSILVALIFDKIIFYTFEPKK